MGKINRTSRDPIEALYDAIDVLHTAVHDLDARKAVVSVLGDNVIQDGDGGIWLDNNDHSIHYVVNGNEYKLTGTAV